MSEIQYGKSADEFKPLDEIGLPDPRQRTWAVMIPGGSRPRTFQDYYDRASKILLHPDVPDDVRVSFETARNLYVYAWYVYRFEPAAQMQAYAAFDFALTKRIGTAGEKMKGMAPRMKYAIEQGWLKDAEITFHRRKTQQRKEFIESQMDYSQLGPEPVPPPDQFVRVLQNTFPFLRNALAHGEPMLGGGTAHTLDLCCDLINQLFRSTTPTS